MTLDEFIKQLKDAGVLGTDTIGYIEIDPEISGGELLIDRRSDNGNMIFNVLDKFD